MPKFVVRRAPKVAPQVQRASDLSIRITSDTERINVLLGKSEERLGSFNFGVAAMVPFPDDGEVDDAVGGPFCHQLWFRRLSSGWGLAVLNGDYERDPDDPDLYVAPTNFQPIRNASREDRIQAAKLLPQLLDSLMSAAEQQHANVVEALHNLEAFVGDAAIEVDVSDDHDGDNPDEPRV